MKIIKSFGITDDMSIIDIACGTGQYSVFTKNKYTGVDFSQKYIDYAKKIYEENENRKFICADVNKMNIGDSSYDIALLIDAMHHLNDEEVRGLFKTLNKIASKFIVICDGPIKQKKYNFIGKFFASLDRGKFIRKKENILELIRENFEIKSVKDLKIMGIESICVITRPRFKSGQNY